MKAYNNGALRGHVCRGGRTVGRCAAGVCHRAQLEYYREGGSAKHLRDIRSMLDTSPELIQRAELDQQIVACGLQEAWRQVQEDSEL